MVAKGASSSLVTGLTLTLKRSNVFGLTKGRHFSSKCTDTVCNLYKLNSLIPSAVADFAVHVNTCVKKC